MKRMILFLIFFLTGLPVALAQQYAIQNFIGNLGGLDGQIVSVRDIKELPNGEVIVVGVMNVALSPGSLTVVNRGFVWTPTGGLVPLTNIVDNRLPFNLSEASGVNRNGQIVGKLRSSFHYYAATWMPPDLEAALLNVSAYHFAQAINDQGFIVGKGRDPRDQVIKPYIQPPEDDMHYFGQGAWYVVGINNQRQVAGNNYPSTSNQRHAFIWDEINGAVDLGALGYSSTATAINNNGVVVGFSGVQAFVKYPNAPMRDLGTPEGFGLMVADDINDAGQIVGYGRLAQREDQRGMLFAEGTAPVDINSLLYLTAEQEGILIYSAVAISPSGKIVGYGFYQGQRQVYLLALLEESQAFIRGDCNGDGNVDISDAVTIFAHLFWGREVPLLEACDVDDSGSAGEADISADDARYLLQFLFSGGPPPAPPFPE